MYLPSCEKRTSEMDEMISEKNERDEGSSSCSNSKHRELACHTAICKHDLRLACWSHNALSLMSANLMVPLELAYMNQLQACGWNSAAVITSVSSSIFAGLISTMLKLWSWIFKFHRLIRRSSLLMKVSPSLLTEMLLMW